MRPLLLLLLLIICAPLFAQQDRRVSIEPRTSELPEEIRIQAAAATSDVTLALWGANRSGGADSAFSILVLQMIRDSVAIGSPVQAHSSQARPSLYCSVIPFDDRFLLLWNDRRDGAPGIYSRWVDASGTFLSEEELFSTAKIQVAAALRTFRTSTSVLVVMEDGPAAARTLRLRRIPLDASRIEQEISLGEGRAGSFRELGLLRDLVAFVQDGTVRLIDGNGIVQPGTIDPVRLENAWFIGRDSSMAVLKDTILTIYRSMFDQQPSRTVILDSLKPSAGSSYSGTIPSYAAAITGETVDSLAITYLILGRFPCYSLLFQVNRIIVDDTVSLPVVVDLYPIPICSSVGSRKGEFGAPTVERGCGNGIVVRCPYRIVAEERHTVIGDYRSTWGHRIDNDGTYTRYDATLPAPDCTTPVARRIPVRTQWKDTSAIRLAVGTPASVHTRIVPFEWHTAQTTPNIFRRGDRLLFTWQQESRAVPSIMAEWDPTIDSIWLISTSNLSGSHIRMATTTVTIQSEKYRVWNSRGGNPYDDFTRSYVQLVDSNWHTVSMYEYLGNPVTLHTSYDPNRNESLGFLSIPGFPNNVSNRIAWIDSGGSKRREMALDPVIGRSITGFIPVDSSWILLYRKDIHRFIEMRNGRATDSFTFDIGVSAGVVLRRLYGPRFLRFFPAGSVSDPRFDIFSLKGKSQARLDLPISPGYSSPSFVESPLDSSIHILWASDNGVRLTRLDKYLRVIVQDSLISQTRDSVRSPVGVFRNDTLFVVWQDFRNPTADIYATTFVSPRVISSPSDTTLPPSPPPTGEPPVDGTLTAGAITPNPATGITTFALEITEPGDATAEIIDMAGQALIRYSKHFDAGLQRWEIDVRGLSNGLYILKVQSGGKVAMMKLMVRTE